MERQIRRLATAFLILFGLLAVNVNYIQVIAADDLANHPANKRLLIQEYDINRGTILASDRSTVLARSRATTDDLKYLRRYPRGRLYGHLTGFYSFVFGRSRLEQSFNPYLSGRSDEQLPQRFIDEVLGRDQRGASIVLSIDPRLQKIADRGLGARQGAVAAINPQTGEVLALASRPSYDPNPLSSHKPREIRRTWDRLNADPDKPLLSNASDQFFPPGSTFKVVVAAAALENGMGPNSTVPNPLELDLPQTTETLENFGGSQCPGGSQISLAQALQVSCNVAFGQFGLKLGGEKLAEQARRFGFNQTIPFDVPFQEGAFPDPSAFDQDQPGLAFSAIGQKDVRVNVLHLALVAGSIGNDGVLMTPRLVREIRDPSGRVLRTLQPEPWGEPMSASSARKLTRMMTAVVEAGTATGAQIPGVSVAGKTGTAQHPGGDPHAWFLAFAPAEDPTIAVAVVVLNGGDLGSEATGGAVAAPIAREVMEAALSG
ncbi:MAG TPA: penicillin-binding protein 2 [Actinomycetota bacterium]|jgi:peptidoglycan glycosyltransferase|nr:penicillin-binding protein 2 [Actinomycetota bacterium]